MASSEHLPLVRRRGGGGGHRQADHPEPADSGALAQAALRLGVAVIPGRLLSAADAGRDWVRLAYTQPPGQLRAAVPLLAQAWQSIRPPAAARQRAG